MCFFLILNLDSIARSWCSYVCVSFWDTCWDTTWSFNGIFRTIFEWIFKVSWTHVLWLSLFWLSISLTLLLHHSRLLRSVRIDYFLLFVFLFFSFDLFFIIHLSEHDFFFIFDNDVLNFFWKDHVCSCWAMIFFNCLDSKYNCCFQNSWPLGFTIIFQEISDFTTSKNSCLKIL